MRQMLFLPPHTISTPPLREVSYSTGEAAYEHTVDVTVSPSIGSVYTPKGMKNDDGKECHHTGWKTSGAGLKPHQCTVSPIQVWHLGEGKEDVHAN